jgi:hypothetical protein
MGGSPGIGGRATGGSPGTGGAGAGGAGTVTDPPCDSTVDNVAPSVDPPGGLAANRVPMFVMLGFDDNAYVDGINWVLDTLRTRKNSDGSAARATFFISAGFASDYFNPAGGQNAPDLLNAWRRMKTDGHEIANHSWSHSEMLAGHGQGRLAERAAEGPGPVRQRAGRREVQAGGLPHPVPQLQPEHLRRLQGRWA